MKTLSKSLAFVAIAATTLLSCTKELEPVAESGKTGSQHIEFKAQINDPGTKATLTSSDDKSFIAQWTGTDVISLNAQSGSYDQTKPATWSVTNSSFGGDFTSVPGKGAWTYVAKYPYTDNAEGKIPFGSSRTQEGNAYNSAFDVMYGTVSYSDAEFGEDNDGKTFEIPMNRLTGIAYFHITGGLDEDVISATLEAPGIAANNVVIAANGQSVTADGSLNSITINFTGTAPKANNLQLWFNVLPGSYSTLKLTVTTTGHVAVLNNTSGVTYAKEQLNKAVLSGLTWTSITKGAEWDYTFTEKAFSHNGTVTLAGTTDQDWTLAGDGGYWGYGDKGQQFGSGSNPYTELSLSSSFGITYGISDVTVNASGASDIAGTISVSVGGTNFASVGSNTLTTTSTDFIFTSPDGNLHVGDVIITCNQTSTKAIYVKSIKINPAPSLAAPVVNAESSGSTVTTSWGSVTNAEKYDVAISDGTHDFSASDLTVLTKEFTEVPDGTYTVTVTAKADGYINGVGTTTIKVKASSDKYALIEESGAFEDNGQYVFILRDGVTSTTYYALHTYRTLEASGLDISNNIITDPDDKYIFIAEAGTDGKFALKNKSTEKYFPAAGSTTAGASSSAVYINLDYLSASKRYKINLGSRFVAYYSAEEARFYSSSNFEDQIASSKALTSQKSGAFEVYKLGYTSKLPLDTPTGLAVNNMTLSWNEVTEAAGYIVQIGSTSYPSVTSTSVTYEGSAGYYDVSVIAVPSDTDTYKNSDPATLTGAQFGTPAATHAEDVVAGQSFTIEGLTVMAVNGKNIIAADNTGSLWIVASSTSHGFAVNDVIKVAGEATSYNKVVRFVEPSTLEKTGESTASYPTPTEYNASKIEDYATHSVIEYAHATGIANSTSRTITVADGKVLYVYGDLTSVDGRTVSVNGYAFGYYNSRVSFMLVGAPTIDQSVPYLKTTPASGETIEWDYDKTTSQTITVEVNNAATYSVDYSDTNSEWNVDDNSGTITVSPKSANSSTTQDKELSITISNGSLSSVVNLKQKKQTNGSIYYVKVSSITSGKKYLIVDGGHIFNGAEVGATTPGVDATITTNGILSTSTIDSYAVTITSDGTKYKVLLSTGKYLVINTSTSSNGNLTSNDTGESITISYTNNYFRFVSSNRNSRGLCYRDTANGFKNYAVSNFGTSDYGGDIDLYEYQGE